MDRYSEKEIAEMIKDVNNEDPFKNESAETYGGDQCGEDDHATSIKAKIEDPEMSSTLNDVAAVVGDDTVTIENPETYGGNKCSDIFLDDADSITSTTDQTQSPVLSVHSPNTTISPQWLVQEVLESPDSEGDSEGESVVADNATSYATSKALAKSTVHFIVRKWAQRKGSYLSSEIRGEKLREVQWVKLGKSGLSKFHREEIDAGGRLNDQHMNYAQAMIKSQISFEGLQCTLFQTTRQP